MDIKKRLSEEFNKILVRKFEVKEKTEEQGFEAYSIINLFGLLYIIGIATLISSEYELSRDLLKIAKEFLNRNFKQSENTNELNKKIIETLSESLLELAYEKITNDKYSDAKSINEENLILMPNNNYIINQRVAIEFYLKNTNEALKFNEILKTSDNNYWLYNRGFLLMSNGNFQAAYNIYSKLSGSKYSGEKEFVQSCIINDELILKKNPKYKYIHFILGFLYYKKLKNIPAALEHFEAFINADKYKKSNDNYMKYFIKDSKKYIKEIKEYLEIKK